ncbi:MAG: lipopolysaccharide kinase InaA family protein [Phycisphaerae bacterium]
MQRLNTVELPALAANAPPALAGAAASRAVPAPATSTTHRSFEGLWWTFRGDFDAVLARVPARVWSAPDARHWQRVKHNPTREVWRATIENRPYYLKYYACPRWWHRLKALVRGGAARAEWNGGLFALRHGIAAVRPCGYTPRLVGARATWSLLVTEAVEPSQPLNEFWRQLNSDHDARRRRQDAHQVLDALAELIARAHQAGFEHLDMHAANILVQPTGPRRYAPLFVDLHSARLARPVSDGAVVRNLAQLNQWFRKNSTIGERIAFLRAYVRWRNEYEHAFADGRPLELSFAELVRALARAAERHAEALGAQRDRRVFHTGRYFGRVGLADGWRATVYLTCKHPSDDSAASRMTITREQWKAVLRDPLVWFGGDAAETAKNSHSAQVRRALLKFDAGPLPVIAKRPRARDGRRALRHALAPSRAGRAWRIGHALLHRDIPTARPLALLERRWGPLVRDCVLLTEGIPGALDLRAFLERESDACRTPRDWLRRKRELSALLVRHLRRLADHGFAHRDCKADNILITTTPQLGLVWIDVDGIRLLRHPLSPAAALRPLARLYVSMRDTPGLTRTDFARFLVACCARRGVRTDAWRDAWRTIAALADRKLATIERRRQWKLDHYGRA